MGAVRIEPLCCRTSIAPPAARSAGIRNRGTLAWHSETGQKALYVSGHVACIEGLPAHESELLLAQLIEHATQARFVFSYRWRPGDVVMWDNRCTMHRATGYDTSAERRVIHRTVVLGDVPS